MTQPPPAHHVLVRHHKGAVDEDDGAGDGYRFQASPFRAEPTKNLMTELPVRSVEDAPPACGRWPQSSSPQRPAPQSHVTPGNPAPRKRSNSVEGHVPATEGAGTPIAKQSKRSPYASPTARHSPQPRRAADRHSATLHHHHHRLPPLRIGRVPSLSAFPQFASLRNQSPAASSPTQMSRQSPSSSHFAEPFPQKRLDVAARISPDAEKPESKLVKQPISQSITQQQLAAEVKAIYHALVQIEAQCVQTVSYHFSQLPNKDSGGGTAPNLKDEWPGLIQMHKTLLNEHHDFFLASQHPSSSPQLQEIASKYSMPARMWKHGIHNFLELLRRHLPHSIEWMLSFIYLAYQITALLFETIPSYKETWIECLGDLARYRMAVEDEDLRDRDTWTGVARSWYCLAVDKNFHVGRLYHHKGILARANAVEQLSLYARSLVARLPFASTMTSILTLLEPFLARKDVDGSLSNDVYLVQAHGCIFGDRPLAEFNHACSCFQATLSPAIAKLSSRWRNQGSYLILANITALCGWGRRNELRGKLEAYRDQHDVALSKTAVANSMTNMAMFSARSQEMAMTMMTTTLNIVATQHHADKNTWAYGHILLTFTYSVALLENGAQYLYGWMDWNALCAILNSACGARSEVESPPEAFDPRLEGNKEPTFEDYLIRGQIWAPSYLDKEFFAKCPDDQDERKQETPKMGKTRLNRMAWLGMEIARTAHKDGPWLHVDKHSGLFSAG